MVMAAVLVQVGKLKLINRVLQLNRPASFRYSPVYQKVQSSGSGINAV